MGNCVRNHRRWLGGLALATAGMTGACTQVHWISVPPTMPYREPPVAVAGPRVVESAVSFAEVVDRLGVERDAVQKARLGRLVAQQVHYYARIQDRPSYELAQATLARSYDPKNLRAFEEALKDNLTSDLDLLVELARIDQLLGSGGRTGHAAQSSSDDGSNWLSDLVANLIGLLDDIDQGLSWGVGQAIEDLDDKSRGPADSDRDGDKIADSSDYDNDGDGYSDQAEARAGTDKNDPNDHPDDEKDVKNNHRPEFVQGPGCWHYTCLADIMDADYRVNARIQELLGRAVTRAYGTEAMARQLARDLVLQQGEVTLLHRLESGHEEPN
ncbi:MAG TPA: thrombospondin type 3 repeat-containing protein [Thermoanaerobaculia bacterium]|nr:thrombospondin type 3 repeat-containing protein [Thermoanaerobaculia bacterium]